MGCAVCLQDGCTALFTAAERGYDKVAKVLLDGGANPDIPDKVDTQMLLLLFEMDDHAYMFLSVIAWVYSAACCCEFFSYQGGYDAFGQRR